MKTIIGQAARGEDYFHRPQITEEIWSKLKSGSNPLLVAPRRVGKSSILFDLLDNPRPNFITVYCDSEAVNDENEFYKKLFYLVNDGLGGIKKYKNKIESFTKDLLSRIDSFSVADASITLGQSKLSYLNELKTMLTNLKLDDDRVIILLDEFAQTDENIIEDKDVRKAISFLENKREFRASFHKRIQFVYAGSIGLENIVSKIDGIKFINDLASIRIPPLSEKEAREFVKKILGDNEINFNEQSFEYLIQKISWLIPFYFQIILDECGKILKDTSSNEITNDVINLAFTNALKHRIYFEHWFTRLRTAYKGDDFTFVKEALNLISSKSSVPSTGILDLALKYKLEHSYNNILNALKHDGYINNNDDPKIYRFNSPLLREWWKRNVAN